MFDIFGTSTLCAGLEIAKIHHLEFVESHKKVFFRADAKLVFTSGSNIVIRQDEIRSFSGFLDGYRSPLESYNFSHGGIIFFDTDESKAIKKQLDEFCDKYFPKEKKPESGA